MQRLTTIHLILIYWPVRLTTVSHTWKKGRGTTTLLYTGVWTVLHINGGTCGVMVIIEGNGHDNQSSNLDGDVCISNSTNTLRKRMHPAILPPGMDK